MIRVIDLRKGPSARPVAAPARDAPPQGGRALDSHALAFITAVQNDEQYRICQRCLDALQVPSGYTVETLAVYGGGSIPECYQAAMEASTARYKIYLHVDAYVVHKGLIPELLHLFRTYPALGLVGVVGATSLPRSGIFWIDNFANCYGRVWQNSAPGFPASLFERAASKQPNLVRFRSFVGDYLPAAVVDGFFVATQYDIPWTHPEFGFEGPWDHVQALEFIKAGFEVGIARQEAMWAFHYGSLEPSSSEKRVQREARLWPQASVLRGLYPEFIRTSIRRLYPTYRRAHNERANSDPNGHARDRLGIVVVAVEGGEVLLSALRALESACAFLAGVDVQLVVVFPPSLDHLEEVVHRVFPHATVLAALSQGGRARAYNTGLRHLGFRDYVLVAHESVEVSPATPATMVRHLREHTSTGAIVASRAGWGIFTESTCAMVRGEALFAVGLFDERFRSTCEDFDWMLRARRKGFAVTLLSDAGVTDHRRRISAPDRFAMADHLVVSLGFVYKHWGRRWATADYWRRRLLIWWLRVVWWRDREAIRHLNEAGAALHVVYSRFRREDELPQRLPPEAPHPAGPSN